HPGISEGSFAKLTAALSGRQKARLSATRPRGYLSHPSSPRKFPYQEPGVRKPETLGALKASGYRPRTVKDEIRENLLVALRTRRPLFPGIVGYEETVVPRVVNALLSRHDVLLLGLRGQAKSRILRALAAFLDDEIPVVRGSEMNDDPLRPV